MNTCRFLVAFIALGCAVVSIPALAGEIFIGEYVEGAAGKHLGRSEFDKAIELYNPDATPVSLTGVSLEIYANGSLIPSATIILSGSIAGNDVYVVAHPSAAPLILSEADLLDSALSLIDGNDAVVLKRAPLDYLDVIGQVGIDPPGGCWCYPYPGCTCNDPLSTLDAVLRRSADYQGGLVIPDEPFTFDPDLWHGYAASSFGGLGHPGFFPDEIFIDGFESADTSGWSAVVP